ncbi:CATRA system-associated protein [Streptomyces albipurpureus]|uniref:CATRA-Associated Small Protein domain-containing protein n=1 Tax=Streptomyces albipurpureus TaxID=2897419 RepID=A0ABT0UHH9_9ACTN|nr:CATRA system-associated protein [Streptomyces sp. CWNU-1]MCM2387677.1 hypothetical protein [Streptomyces sp. CWNU-1]
METPEGDRASLDPAEEREAAADVLTEIVGLVLPPKVWALVAHRLDAMEAAVRAGDVEALAEAAGQLELMGLTRIRKRPDDEGESAAADLVDRIGPLVHELRSETSAEEHTDDEPAGG